MWRPAFHVFRRQPVRPSPRERLFPPRLPYSTAGRLPRSTAKLTLVSASVGVIVGAGYGGYTHYKVNKKSHVPVEATEYAFFESAPKYKANFKVISDNDNSNLQLVLFQYRTCPFCCKVRAYLDYRGVGYEVVEVDAVLRQAIRWSPYKKVPILLAKVDGGYQQLLDSTAIVSVLESYARDKASQLRDLLNYYPVNNYVNEQGKKVTDIVNKYFIMHNASVSEQQRILEAEEREWRQWADSVLVHVLSPNVYRSLPEALQAFRWFAEAGRWRETFPAWEVGVMVNGGALAMWLISKRLKTRHNLKDDVRQSLYDASNHWMKALKAKGTTFMGGEEPNLADLSVFGILSSIEGCDAFRELRTSTDIAHWFDATKNIIEERRGKVLPV